MARCLLLILVCASLACMPAYSQEEDLNYGYGSVLEIKSASNEIVIDEYDYENDEEIVVTYSVHPEVKMENITSWKSIPKGTYIDVEYVTDKMGKKVIKYLTVYEKEIAELEME